MMPPACPLVVAAVARAAPALPHRIVVGGRPAHRAEREGGSGASWIPLLMDLALRTVRLAA